MSEVGEILALDRFSPVQGLMSDLPPTTLPPGFVPRSRNVRFLNGMVYKRTGYVSWGDALSDTIMHLKEFRTTTGTAHFMCATVDRLYSYTSGSDTWTDRAGADIFTGDIDDIFTSAQYLDNFVITNGQDNVYVWPGVDNAAKLTGASGYQVSDFHNARMVVAFKDRILLLNIKEDGNWHPQKLRWSDTGGITVWEGGTSGSNTLVEDKSDIVGALVLGNDLAIYKGQSVVAARYTALTPLFSFTTMVSDLGLAARNCIVDIGSVHLFLGSDYDLHMYQGGRVAPSITKDRIRREFMTTINKEYAHRSFAIADFPHHLVLFFVPTQTEYPDTCWVYDYINHTWAKDRHADYFTAAGTTSRPTGLMIDDLVGMIDVQHWFIDDMEPTDKAPTIVLGDKDGDTHHFDNYSQSDQGESIDAFVETPDFVGPQAYQRRALRHTEIQLEAAGDSVDVGYSEDESQSWTELATVVMDSDFAIYKLFYDRWSRKLRYRFRHKGSTGTFKMRWCSPRVVLRSGL